MEDTEDSPSQAEHRLRLRPWLESMLDGQTVRGLEWLDQDRSYFKIPWKHRSKKDWDMEHIKVFMEWAKHTGKFREGEKPDYVAMKTRLRCAFNKAPDIEEVKSLHSLKSADPYKVYCFTPKQDAWPWSLTSTSNGTRICTVTPMVQQTNTSRGVGADDVSTSEYSSSDEDEISTSNCNDDLNSSTPTELQKRKRKSRPKKYHSELDFVQQADGTITEMSPDQKNLSLVDNQATLDAAKMLLAFTNHSEDTGQPAGGKGLNSIGKIQLPEKSDTNLSPVDLIPPLSTGGVRTSDLIPSLLRKPPMFGRPSVPHSAPVWMHPMISQVARNQAPGEQVLDSGSILIHNIKKSLEQTMKNKYIPVPSADQHIANIASEIAANTIDIKVPQLSKPAQSLAHGSIHQKLIDLIIAKRKIDEAPPSTQAVTQLLSAPASLKLSVTPQTVASHLQDKPVGVDSISISAVVNGKVCDTNMVGVAKRPRITAVRRGRPPGGTLRRSSSGVTFSNHGNIMATGVVANSNVLIMKGSGGTPGGAVALRSGTPGSTLAEETLRMRAAYGVPLSTVPAAGTQISQSGSSTQTAQLMPVVIRKSTPQDTTSGRRAEPQQCAGSATKKEDVILDLRVAPDGVQQRRLSDEEMKALDLSFHVYSEDGELCYQGPSGVTSEGALDLTLKRKSETSDGALGSQNKRLQAERIRSSGSLSINAIWDLSKDKTDSDGGTSDKLREGIAIDLRYPPPTVAKKQVQAETPVITETLQISRIAIQQDPEHTSAVRAPTTVALTVQRNPSQIPKLQTALKNGPRINEEEQSEQENSKQNEVEPCDTGEDDSDTDSDGTTLPTVVSSQREVAEEMTAEMEEVRAVRQLLQMSLPDNMKKEKLPSEQDIQEALRETARKKESYRKTPYKYGALERKSGTLASSTPSAMKDGNPRQRLRPWLESQINSGQVKGLSWIDRHQGIFKVPWKHGGKHDWSSEDSRIFMEWAKHTGRYREGIDDEDYATWKTRLRCAFNKAPDIVEIKEQTDLSCPEPYRVYKLIPKRESRNMTPFQSDDEEDVRQKLPGVAPVPLVVSDLTDQKYSGPQHHVESGVVQPRVPSIQHSTIGTTPYFTSTATLSCAPNYLALAQTEHMDVPAETVIDDQEFYTDPSTGAPMAAAPVTPVARLTPLSTVAPNPMPVLTELITDEQPAWTTQLYEPSQVAQTPQMPSLSTTLIELDKVYPSSPLATVCQMTGDGSQTHTVLQVTGDGTQTHTVLPAPLEDDLMLQGTAKQQSNVSTVSTASLNDGLFIELMLRATQVNSQQVQEGQKCCVTSDTASELTSDQELTDLTTITYPKLELTPTMEDDMQKMCALLPYIKDGIVFTSVNGDILATRHCRCGVHYISGNTDEACVKLKCKEENVKIFDYERYFLPTLERFGRGDGPPPSAQVHLLFGQTCSLDELDDHILISMKVTSNKAARLLDQIQLQQESTGSAEHTDMETDDLQFSLDTCHQVACSVDGRSQSQ